MDTVEKRKKRANFAPIIDTPMPPKKRRMTVSLLKATNVQEVIRDSGASPRYVQEATAQEAVKMPTARQMLQKRDILDNLIKELDDIIALVPDSPLKYSDKLRAIEIKAQLSGLSGKEGNTTVNIGVMDLRQASEQQLLEELDKIEKKKREAIDVESVSQPNTTDDLT